LPDIYWYGFHTDHDFGYLLRTLSGEDLPPSETKFLENLHYYFPNIYDIKTIADAIIPGGFTRSLSSLSQMLSVKRDDNNEHQAGSDSKITARCFFELKLKDEKTVDACNGEIFGLGRTD